MARREAASLGDARLRALRLVRDPSGSESSGRDDRPAAARGGRTTDLPPTAGSAPTTDFAPITGAAPPGRFVGRAGIQRVDPDVGEVVGDLAAIELMYALAFDAWGHGFASEIGRRLLDVARDDLGRAEIIADTVPHNVRSRRVMEGLGFVYEREFWHDDHTMVLYRKTLGVAGAGSPSS